MNNYLEQSDPSFFKFAFCAAGLSCLAVAFTAFSADADEPPKDHRAAQRAAAADDALARLDPSGTARAGAAARLSARRVERAARAFEPVDLDAPPTDWVAAGLDIAKTHREGDNLVQTLPNGGKVYLTIEPKVQEHIDRLMARKHVPHGGAALIEPGTGRVLAMVSHTQAEPAVPHIARKPKAPTASVFKIVTASALIESGGVNPDHEVCYHGGYSYLRENNIKDDPAHDNKCADLGHALAWSINSIIAKLAYKNLSQRDLQAWAKRFGYNTTIPFELPIEPSRAEFVDDPLERARTAAGFWHTYLSPMHAALIAATVANDGVMMRPTLIDKYVGPSGKTTYRFQPRVLRRVMSKKTAHVMGDLLEGTTEFGTARRYFAQRAAFPDDVDVAGKTGTLSNKDPYLGFTWFVGFAHDEAGQSAAVAGLACNKPKWWIKGHYVASETLRSYYEVVDERRRQANRQVASQR